MYLHVRNYHIKVKKNYMNTLGICTIGSAHNTPEDVIHVDLPLLTSVHAEFTRLVRQLINPQYEED